MEKRYASQTDVAITRSKAAIEAMLVQHGAKDFATGWNSTHDTLQFTLQKQTIRFVLPRVDEKNHKFTRTGRERSDRSIAKQIEQANRQRWRALYLVIRAKIEAVEAGIAIFEAEFLAFIVQPNDLTIGDMLVPQLMDGGTVQKLLKEATR